MRVGPDRETFTRLYEEANGDYYKFNALLLDTGQEPMASRSFRRRSVEWGCRSSRSRAPRLTERPSCADEPDARPIAGGTIDPPDRRRRSLAGKRFVFTAAQNNTFVHEAFWQNLLAFCDHRNAQLVVGKFRYNKAGFQNSTKDSDEDLWFDPKVVPYVLNESARLDASPTGTVWCGELDILPTATSPLSGFDNYTRLASSVIPHAKVQMKSVPVMKGTPKKMLYTTGACTQRNYIQRKAGQKAEFHHVFGALYIEIDSHGREFRRQLIADSTGTFYDLTEKFSDGVASLYPCVEAINWGDIHAELLDNRVREAGWLGHNNMLDTLQPAYQFVHDLTDFRARNHHSIKNPHFLAERYYTKSYSVEQGMQVAAALLEEIERPWCTTVVVESNHDQAFRRWLVDADIRTDSPNAEYYHRANAEVYKRIRQGYPKFHIFEWAVRQHSELGNTQFLSEDDSFVICGEEFGIECGMHGHRGPNGARGTPNSLRGLGRKCNTGHTHSAGIIDGIYTAGISCLEDLGYNVGPSSWSQSHIVTYRNGKRAIITIDKGKWRAED